ncbi:hypothetical protein [Lacinutrix sp. MedPE-SW]|uniref:hypothetical protein n=1 Tax=Lacinutrix sp. MedPE-SW TaxID=1860087 RepID=UPI0009164527|nr:hypothetical protein [Lacinutrix sp. MedPE-SW]OIQ18221.1 MAG: hypothetical protein BM549_12275 [Lacinutrix sp. MedPE-SW]
MKTNITLFVAFLFLGTTLGFSQNEEECNQTLSIMTEYVKAKNFKAAYEPFKKLRTECPKYNPGAQFKYGEDMFEGLIDETEGDVKKGYIQELSDLWDARIVEYAKKSPKGKYLAKKAELRYDNRKLLGLTDAMIYNEFDAIYKTDLANFKSPKGLYVYFKSMVSLYDAKQKTAQELFDKYDDVVDKLEKETDFNTKKLNEYVEKEASGATLAKKEARYKKFYSQTVNALEKIAGSVDTELGDRANCSTLIPLYQKDYEANKNNGQWLQRAMNKLYSKGCKEDPMFVKIVKQKNTVEPNEDTAYYLYLITGEQQYFDQTLSLTTDPLKKAKLYNKIAKDFKAKGSYGKARNYYMKAMELNPSSKNAHLQIANMYGNSAKNCGSDNFTQRAVFWLAAQEAEKGGNASAASRYRGLAPTKTEIFNKSMGGKTIKIGCWIQRSVTVPNI